MGNGGQIGNLRSNTYHTVKNENMVKTGPVDPGIIWLKVYFKKKK